MLAKIRKMNFYYHLSMIKNPHVRYFYSLLFNLRHFSFSVSRHLPFIFYKGAYAEIGKGAKITISESLKQGKCHIRIGEDTKDFTYQCEKSYLCIEGSATFLGDATIRRGALIDVKGEFIFGNYALLGPRVRIRAHNSISIGQYVRIAHETQIFDTNFHFSEDTTSPGYYPISKPIHIGDFCWIGNRSTISKGTYLPDFTTVASNSLVTKDFSNLPKNSLIGGAPAKLLRNNFSRVWDADREFEYQKREFEWYRKKYEGR